MKYISMIIIAGALLVISHPVRGGEAVIKNNVHVEADSGGNTADGGVIQEGSASASVHVITNVNGTTTPTSTINVEVTSDGEPTSVTREQVVRNEEGRTIIENIVSARATGATTTHELGHDHASSLRTSPAAHITASSSQTSTISVTGELQTASPETTVPETTSSAFERLWRALEDFFRKLTSLFSL